VSIGTLSLRFDRERLWYEFLRAGFGAADLKRVVTYLQKEICAERRNIGALKLSNLLQLDRFEEDLNISRVRLKPPAPHPNPTLQPALDPEIDDQQRDKDTRRTQNLSPAPRPQRLGFLSQMCHNFRRLSARSHETA
jgi:hypothetical protein